MSGEAKALKPQVADANKAQLRAADPAASVWVAASAGTGKTTVLTSRVLTLMLRDTPPERILCLTFTKAAAAEMSLRLARRLKGWTTCSDADLDNEIHGLLGERPDEERRKRARRLFARVLDLPGGMAIHTIHAFCQSLLARFPLEAGIAPHSTLLDERSAREALAEAREEVFAQIAAGEAPAALRQAAEAVAVLQADQSFQETLGALARHRARLLSLFERFGEATVLDRLRRVLGVRPEDTLERMNAESCAEQAFDGRALREALTVLLQGSKIDRDNAALIEPWLAAEPEARLALLSDYQSAFLKKDGEIKADSRLVTDKSEAGAPGTRAALRGEAERLCALRLRLRALELFEANAALLRLGVAILQRYERGKRERAQLDYEDLIHKTRDLVSESSRNAWVLFKLDGGLDHILVDEAQDTNREQWQIIQYLTEEFFAGAGAHEEREGGLARTLFAVGDVKQSIFSFQGAEPAAFLSERDRYSRRVREAGQRFENVPLNASFRSVPAVLRLVDAVFSSAEANDGVLLGEEWLKHVATRTGQAGHLELWPTVGPLEQEESDPWVPPLTAQRAASGEERLAAQIAAKIAAWTKGAAKAGEEGWLESQDRQVRPGDIMILVRRRKRFVAEMVRALKERGVPVAGVDRMVLTDQLAVQDLIAFGRVMLLPDDDLTLAAVLKSPLIGLEEEALFALAHGRGRRSLWSVLRDRREERRAFADAAERLEALMERADFLSPFAFYAELLSARGGRRQLLGRLGPDAGDPVDEFLDQALLFERDHQPSLQGFLHWIEAGRQEVKRDLDRGRGQVRVMTVHGAKGLQAPIVFLPDTRQIPSARGPDIFWLQPENEDIARLDAELPLWLPAKELEEQVAGEAKGARKAAVLQEYRRLLYVALTRAEDRLYICGYDGKKAPSAGNWYEMIAGPLGAFADPLTFSAGTDLPADLRWEGEGLIHRTAQEEPPASTRTSQQKEEEIPPLPDWALQPPSPEESPPRPLQPSRPSESEPALVTPVSAAEGLGRFQRGLLIHRLLELLPDLPASARSAAGARLLARPLYGLGPAQREELLTETLSVLEDPVFASIFGPGSLAEVPLAGKVEGRTRTEVVSGQIDRLLVSDEEVLVVDYKTNRPPPGRPEETAPVYLRQMAAYRALLREIYPGRAVRAALLWTAVPRLMQISSALLDEHAP